MAWQLPSRNRRVARPNKLREPIKAAASIRDIAQRANVSIGTVDRVLHDRGRVSEQTRARVRRIITDLGYRPNIYARNLSLAKTFRFGVIMPNLDQDSGYWRILANGIELAHRQLGPARVRVLYYHFDRYSNASFEKAFQEAMNADVDGLFLAPVLSVVAEKWVKTIPDTIPYAFFDSTLPDAKPLTTIGQDAYQSGVLAAHLMLKMISGEGTIVAIKVTPADFHIVERLRGFKSVMVSLSSVRIVEHEVDSHGGEKAFRAAASGILEENQDLVGVFVSNAWTHPFAKHIHEMRPKSKIGIIGYDLVPKNRQCLQEGLIDFLISQRPVMQGFEGISALYRTVVLRDKVKDSVMVPLDIITKDNIQYYQD